MRIEDSQWFAVRVKSRNEDSVAGLLNYKGYTTYVPRSRAGSGRAAGHGTLFFPGYVLCQTTAQAAGLVLTTPMVLSIVSLGGVAAGIPDAEIERVRDIERSGIPAQAWAAPAQGMRVRVISGPLAGLAGHYVGVQRRNLLLVSLQMLQRCVSVEVDVRCLEFIECEEAQPVRRLESSKE